MCPAQGNQGEGGRGSQRQKEGEKMVEGRESGGLVTFTFGEFIAYLFNSSIS